MATTPGAGDATSRRERLALLGCWYLIGAWCIVPAFGRIAPDTKLELTWDPIRFLWRASSAWDPSASFGRLQNQSIGYLFPMGLFTSAARAVGVPVWLVPRLWLALVLGVALAGAHRLARLLGIATPSGRVVAALAYALAPSVLLVASYQAGTLLPHALCPWVLVPLLDHERLGARRAGLRSAAAVALMGGINAASTLAVLPLALVWFLTRRPGPARRRLLGWWLGGLVAATAWWAVPFAVTVRHGFDFTPFTEQAWLTASTQSAADAWRGTGNWLVYIDQGGRTIHPGGRGLVQDGRAIAGSMLLVLAGAAGLARRDAPGRRWLVPAASLGALALAAAYTGTGGSGPIAAGLRDLLDGPLVAFRNLAKFSPLVQLPLALGVGHLVATVARRSSPTAAPAGLSARARPLAGPGAAAVAVLAVLASIAPTIPGRLLLPGSFEDLPAAWYDAAAWADGRPGHTRTLVLPGAVSADYAWGRPQDEPLALLLDGPWAVRDVIPLGGNGSTRLLDGLEDALARATLPAGFGEALRRAGIGRIVVRNDLVSDHDGAPAPATLRRLLRDAPGLAPGPSFGPVLDPATVVADDRIAATVPDGDPIRQLDTYLVGGAVDRVRVTSASAALGVSGAPEALVLLPAELTGDRAVLVAGDRAGLATDLLVATDTARHRDVAFGGIRDNRSWTLGADERGPLTGGDPKERWSDPDPPPRTVAELRGAAELDDDAPDGRRDPATQPFAAFDGDPATAWAPTGEPEGRRLRVRFAEPTTVGSVTVRVPTTLGRHVAAVRVETDGASVPATIGPDGTAVVALGSGTTRAVSIVIEEVRDGPVLAPVGLSSVELAGHPITRPLRAAPLDADERVAADGAVLDRARVDPGSIGGGDEDGLLDRIVALAPEPLGLSGEASAVAGDDLDRLLAAATPAGNPAAPTVTGGSWPKLPGHGPAAAFDGRDDTFWAVSPATPEADGPVDVARLRWAEPRSIDALTIHLAGHPAAASAGDLEVGVTVDGERRAHRPDPDGTIRLDLRDVTDLTLDLRAGGGSTGRPVTVRAIEPAGAPSAPVPSPADDAPVELACGDGPPVEVDGRAVPTSLATTVGDVLAGRPARWTACGTVTPTRDDTRITARWATPFRVDTLVALPPDARPAPAATRTATVERWGDEDRAITVGPGDAVVVAGTENANAGWAVGGGARSVRVDGWREAMVVPAADEAATITLRYAPGRVFRVGLAVGLALLAALLVAAAVRPRRRADAPEPTPAERPTGRRLPAPVAVALAALVGLGLGGPLALAVVPLALAARRWPALPARVVTAALAVVAVVLLAPVGTAWASTNAAFEPAAQVAAVLAWVALPLTLLPDRTAGRLPDDTADTADRTDPAT